jgi:type IV pilus assembly protein PilX
MRQTGAMALIVVMVLLSFTLLGGYAFARVAASGGFVAGNVALREGAQQASEAGVNTAFQQLRDMTGDEVASDWYFPTAQPLDAAGLPATADWTRAPALKVSAYEVRYVAERLCMDAPVVDRRRQCLLKQEPGMQSRKVGAQAFEPPSGLQYRITVRVTGPKGSATYVHALVTRG